MKNTLSRRTSALRLSKEAQTLRLRRILHEELTELQRYTITAYYFDQKTLEQIGTERGVTKSTVWRTLKRAEEKIRRFMKYG